MLNFHLPHREVLGIASRERHTERRGHRSDQAVRLRQLRARRRVIAPPIAGLDAFGAADRRDAQPVEETTRRSAFGIAQTTMDLLDANRRREWHISVLTERCKSLDGSPPAAQHIDQDRGVEQDAHI